LGEFTAIEMRQVAAAVPTQGFFVTAREAHYPKYEMGSKSR
jgi:hypothetical protein